MCSSIRQLRHRGRLRLGRVAALQIRQPIVEFDLHSHRAERFDEMGLVRQQETGMAGLQDHLGFWFKHLIAQSPFKHPNDPPYGGLGAVFSTQPGRERRFIEDRSALVWYFR